MMFKFMNIFVQPIVFCCIFATSGFAQDYKSHQIVSDFECGDLLYGLQKPARAWYLSTIEQKICQTDNPFHYTEEPAKAEPSSYMGSVPCMPKPNFPPKRIVYCTADVYNKKLHSSDGTKTELDKQYAAYMKAKGLGQFDSEDGNDELKFLCKNAIGFTMSQGKKVRFLLDELNMGVISSKERRLGLSFTSVELRYIYRHWEEFKGYVVFYERGQRLEAAPWENDPKIWETYDAHRRDKKNYLKKEKIRPAPVIEDVDLDNSTGFGIDAGYNAFADSNVSVAYSGGNPNKRMKRSSHQREEFRQFSRYLREGHVSPFLTQPSLSHVRQKLFFLCRNLVTILPAF